MDKKELERRLEAAEKQSLGLLDEIKNLKAQLADMRDEPEIPDMPFFRANETYWRIYPTLKRYFKSHSLPSDYVGECYNLFHTKEYADEFSKKCKLIAMMLHCKWYLCPDYVPDFTNSNEEKHYVYYDVCGEKYTTDWRCTTINNEVFFDTKENAQKCADWLNEHWKEDGNGKTNSKTP